MLSNIPVTLVIFDFDRSQPELMYNSLGLVIAIVDCDISERDKYINQVRQYTDAQGRNIQCMMFRRYPRIPDSLIEANEERAHDDK